MLMHCQEDIQWVGWVHEEKKGVELDLRAMFWLANRFFV